MLREQKEQKKKTTWETCKFYLLYPIRLFCYRKRDKYDFIYEI
jgi:hypothetical protein